ncbi:hypothetical protein [Alicyclobacillus sp. ALC3]|uniref:lysine 5,6-aminomutase reactivase subunit KamB n=1 Tax=Alicyclobacillus sp. ALC3 TaxID=2796143 RepID=UPI0023789AC0|nr:hypothetical protein [Alicyclobacillus sp. ALC3]WDL95132.1 hypothetical protein JC200_11910 [Alicyclobacillus sp. ALC3]
MGSEVRVGGRPDQITVSGSGGSTSEGAGEITRLAINLPALCRERNWRNLAFIGVTKHAGKTTALNAFIAQLQADAGSPQSSTSERIGLLSIGLDGERLDTIMGIRKPPVEVPVGTLVASAEGALAESDAGLEYLEALPIDSPLGQVLVAQVTRPGHVLLAGVRQRQHVQQVATRLRHYGATWCLVDGAFDRVAAAAPHLVDAAVLAVGATAGATVDAVIAQATPVVQRFLLPEVAEDLRDELHPAYQRGEIGVLGHFATEHDAAEGARLAAAQEACRDAAEGARLAAAQEACRDAAEGARLGAAQGDPLGAAERTALNVPHGVSGHPDYPMTLVCLPKTAATTGPWLHPDWPGELSAVRAVYVPGALTASLLEGLLAHATAPTGVHLVVGHPAQVLAPRAALESWYRRGHRLSVWTPLPLAAIAVNPHSVNGADLPVVELAAAAQALAPGVPVFDALALGGSLASADRMFDAVDSGPPTALAPASANKEVTER